MQQYYKGQPHTESAFQQKVILSEINQAESSKQPQHEMKGGKNTPESTEFLPHYSKQALEHIFKQLFLLQERHSNVEILDNWTSMQKLFTECPPM